MEDRSEAGRHCNSSRRMIQEGEGRWAVSDRVHVCPRETRAARPVDKGNLRSRADREPVDSIQAAESGAPPPPHLADGGGDRDDRRDS